MKVTVLQIKTYSVWPKLYSEANSQVRPKITQERTNTCEPHAELGSVRIKVHKDLKGKT